MPESIDRQASAAAGTHPLNAAVPTTNLQLNTGHAVLLTEWFPPAVGGSGEFLANIYSRISTSEVDVITACREEPEPEKDRTFAPLRVVRRPFGLTAGLLSPGALRVHARLLREVRRLSRQQTVLHCARALPEGSVGWLSRLAGGSKYLCWTFGEELSYAAQSREMSWLLRRVHRRSSALIAITDYTAGLLRQLGNPAHKVHVVLPGVDSSRFRPSVGRESTRLKLLRPGELLLLTVGRLQRRKGHDLVIRALARIGQHTPPLRYAIIGDGPEADRLKRLAVEEGVADRVSFVGQVSPDDLPSYYAAADIFVHPNRKDGQEFEGFGLVFLEAAAAGLPSIGGTTGGVPEAIAHGATGMLVSGEDQDELERTIRQLAESESMRSQLGTAARSRALREFTWDRAARQVEAIDASLRANA